jgi:integrase
MEEGTPMKGSIRQRGDTHTAYWYTNDPATGGRVQHTKGGFKTQGAAQAHLNAILGKVQDGSWRPDRTLTVRELFEDHWLPAQSTRGLKPASLEQYRHVAADWIVPHVGGVKVTALTPRHVTALVQTLSTTTSASGKQGLSPRSVQIAVQVLKAATKWAVPNIPLGRDPLVGVQRPRAESKAMVAWTSDEARRFLEATRDDRLVAAWALLLTRGLRRGELAGLRWKNIDLDRGELRVLETRIVVDGRVVTSTPKTAAGRRTIALDESLVGLLRSHRARQSSEKLAAGSAFDRSGYLVADELGRPYSPEWISDRFDELQAGADLPRIRLHDCRHTAASLMLAAGVPVKVVSEMLGHASPTITLEVYAHVMPGMAAEAGAALSAELLGS